MKTIAILYPGDMGGHVAKTLKDHAFRVVSYLEGRNAQTHETAAEIGIEGLTSLDEVAAISDLVISLVPPAAVMPVAEAYLAAASRETNPARFVDMNAKSIATANELSAIFTAVGAPFTNACIIGRAAHVEREGVIFSSGERSPELEEWLGEVFRVSYLGDEVSAATVFKMCFTGFNKTISAAIFEIATAANRFGITERLFEEISMKLPGVISEIGSLMGNYPKHLTRRKQEMEELSKMLSGAGLPNHIASAAANTLGEIELRKNFDAYKDTPDTPFLTLMKALNA